MVLRLLVLVVAYGAAGCDGGAATPPAADGTGIAGVALAGPVCPVERPDDPACAPRPVAGAAIVVRDAAGTAVATATTAADGRYEVAVPPGQYTIEGAPIEGFMGIPAPIDVEVRDGFATVDLSYDTGIR